MKFTISLLIFLVFFLSEALYSQNKYQNYPDSVRFIKDGNIIIITTQAEINKTKEHKNKTENAPSPPIILTIDSSVHISMTIKDSTYTDVKYFTFDAKTPGKYHINAWAFYENLPSGSYTCIIEYPGKMIRQKFLKME